MFEYEVSRLLMGDSVLINNPEFKTKVNEQVVKMLSKTNYSKEEYDIIGELLHIGNIVYNNTDLDDFNQIIDNDSYDILLEKYRVYNPNVQVGAEPVYFAPVSQTMGTDLDAQSVITWNEDYKDPTRTNPFLFLEDIYDPQVPIMQEPVISWNGQVTGKKYRSVSHGNPNLVGTLDKCKCVLCTQAQDMGVLNDPAVKVLERDFFQDHFKRGIINNNTFFRIMLELKYDGMSVVVTVKDRRVIYAVSRGDTGNDKATDYTPILWGYYFPNLPMGLEMDIKCEAVMTYQDLAYYNYDRQKNYKNCRSAIQGLFGSNDGALYQKYITLVPLAVAHSSISGKGTELDNIDRITEIDFINKYLITKEFLRSAYVEGDYHTILYMIKKFVDEAEYIRPQMPVMYDGVVLSYVDQDIRKALGRENFVNKYSIAIKFNTMKKLTTLIAITYTVGQDGRITPMAHYNPVTFLGTVHTKSSLASLDRFNKNNFKLGNIIQVEYRNDVMPYVTTPELDHNMNNPNPVLRFIEECPVCNTKLVISQSGMSAKCPNPNCKGRQIARMANMMDKLGLKDIAEATMEKLDIKHFYEFMELKEESIRDIIGEDKAATICRLAKDIKTNPIYDYQIIGALGFSGIAQETWKKIFDKISLSDFIDMILSNNITNGISGIKGVGPKTIEIIATEISFFMPDIMYINDMKNIKGSKGSLNKPKIRVTGFRDPELMNELNNLGFDASDKGVTKDTLILLVPDDPSFTSSKLNKVGPNTMIIGVTEFRNDMDNYLTQAINNKNVL